MSINKIAIIGLGVIGGSLASAIKSSLGNDIMLIGIDNDHNTLKIAVESGIVDYSTANFEQGVVDADIVFLCTPVLQIVPIVERILPYLKCGAILTDVGSTKKLLGEKIRAILPQSIEYVAGHPMAGREKSGVGACDKNLFKDKWYIIVPEISTSAKAVDEVCKIIKLTGANITTLETEAHDQCAAVISHVPHVAAAALVNLLDLHPDPEASFKLAGGGFKDTTRIASSNADMWSDICLTNAQAISDSLIQLQALLGNVITAVQNGEREVIHDFFSRAKKKRDALINASPSTN